MEYTILQVARKLGFTKNAVKYQVTKLPEETIKKDKKGVIHITEEGVVLLNDRMGKKEPPHNQQPVNNYQTTTYQPVKNNQQPSVNRQTTSKQPVDNDSTTTCKTKIEEDIYPTLLKTIEELRNQIKVKDHQIERLTDALVAAQQTAAAAQALHAGSIKKELEGVEKQEESNPKEEHKIFSFFKKKRSYNE